MPLVITGELLGSKTKARIFKETKEEGLHFI